MTPLVTKGMVSSYLAFPSLPLARRFISVALFLRSPSADVIRYPVLEARTFLAVRPFGIIQRDRAALLPPYYSMLFREKQGLFGNPFIASPPWAEK